MCVQTSLLASGYSPTLTCKGTPLLLKLILLPSRRCQAPWRQNPGSPQPVQKRRHQANIGKMLCKLASLGFAWGGRGETGIGWSCSQSSQGKTSSDGREMGVQGEERSRMKQTEPGEFCLLLQPKWPSKPCCPVFKEVYSPLR